MIPFKIIGTSIQFNLPKNVLIFIFIILIILIILVLFSIYKTVTNSTQQKYLHNNMFVLPHDANIFKLVQL